MKICHPGHLEVLPGDDSSGTPLYRAKRTVEWAETAYSSSVCTKGIQMSRSTFSPGDRRDFFAFSDVSLQKKDHNHKSIFFSIDDGKMCCFFFPGYIKYIFFNISCSAGYWGSETQVDTGRPQNFVGPEAHQPSLWTPGDRHFWSSFGRQGPSGLSCLSLIRKQCWHHRMA